MPGRQWPDSATYGINTGDPRTLTSHAFGVVRDGISETDAIGRWRRERLRQTAGFRAVNSRWVRTRV